MLQIVQGGRSPLKLFLADTFLKYSAGQWVVIEAHHHLPADGCSGRHLHISFSTFQCPYLVALYLPLATFHSAMEATNILLASLRARSVGCQMRVTTTSANRIAEVWKMAGTVFLGNGLGVSVMTAA